MNKADRRERISTKATEMAMSGEFENYQTIEMSLRQQGYREARQVLDDREKRLSLDLMCQIARLAATRGITYDEAQMLPEAAEFQKQYNLAMGIPF